MLFYWCCKLIVQIRKVPEEEKKNQFVFLEGYLFNVCNDIFMMNSFWHVLFSC